MSDKPQRTGGRSDQHRETTVIARLVTRTVVPLILVTAVALLLRGHNLPGGGFVAGVLTVTAFALTAIIYGLDELEETLLGVTVPGRGVLSGGTETFARTFAGGLALAASGGVAAMLFGYPFLSQAVLFVEGVPLYHEFEIASALVFDLGVYLVVVGALLTIVKVVGRE
jgi:multicomponent Na+:H+ antiporter subunit B